MRPMNEDEAEVLVERHLSERGWDIADLTVTRKRWRAHLDGGEADRVFLQNGKVAAILEAKKPGKDLWAALEQAKRYARAYRVNTGGDVPLLFASDGGIFLRQNLKANTLPERIQTFPTPACQTPVNSPGGAPVNPPVPVTGVARFNLDYVPDSPPWLVPSIAAVS